MLSLLISPSAADFIVPGDILPLCCFPGGSASLQRHAQLSDWHCHRPVRRPCLLPGRVFTRVQATTCHHQLTAWVHHKAANEHTCHFCLCTLSWRVVVSHYRFFDLLHPVHLLLCTDRDRQKWIASHRLQNVTQESLHPHDWQSPGGSDQGFCCEKKRSLCFVLYTALKLRLHWPVYNTENAATDAHGSLADLSWTLRTFKQR